MKVNRDYLPSFGSFSDSKKTLLLASCFLAAGSYFVSRHVLRHKVLPSACIAGLAALSPLLTLAVKQHYLRKKPEPAFKPLLAPPLVNSSLPDVEWSACVRNRVQNIKHRSLAIINKITDPIADFSKDADKVHSIPALVSADKEPVKFIAEFAMLASLHAEAMEAFLNQADSELTSEFKQRLGEFLVKAELTFDYVEALNQRYLNTCEQLQTWMNTPKSPFPRLNENEKNLLIELFATRLQSFVLHLNFYNTFGAPTLLIKDLTFTEVTKHPSNFCDDTLFAIDYIIAETSEVKKSLWNMRQLMKTPKGSSHNALFLKDQQLIDILCKGISKPRASAEQEEEPQPDASKNYGTMVVHDAPV